MWSGLTAEDAFDWKTAKDIKLTRLTYNCAHLRSTKESLTDSVKNLFVRKKFCVKIFLGENLLGEHFLSELFFWVKFFG